MKMGFAIVSDTNAKVSWENAFQIEFSADV